MSAITLINQILAYDDVAQTSNPQNTPINRRRVMSNIPCENAGTVPVPLDPLSTATVIDGTRTLAVDGTTAFALTLSPLAADKYRLTWTGGTNPGFRTNRSLNTSSIVLTLVVNSNLTMSVTAGSGSPFSAVVVGDEVMIPGVSTGDPTSPFNALNEGRWRVLSASSTVLTLARYAGEVFSGISEVVTPVAAPDFQAYSAAGVQADFDTVDISAGFAVNTQRSYDITAVNPKYIEFSSGAPLGQESGILPTASGIAIYTSSKRFLFIETDQELVVRLNGDTGNTNRVSPIIAGDPDFPAQFHKIGPVWKLVLVNRSSSRANVVVASAE